MTVVATHGQNGQTNILELFLHVEQQNAKLSSCTHDNSQTVLDNYLKPVNTDEAQQKGILKKHGEQFTVRYMW